MSERLRVGIGFDAHAFADERRLVLAGVEVPSARGLAGHSDADLISHAVTDALLGAAGGADIGELYPSHDPALEGASSVELLRRAWATLFERGWSIVNVDAIVIMQEPRLAPHREAMRDALAAALEVDRERVTVRASTTDLLGFTGRGEGAACQAVALLEGPE
jgi:2-C-methyl-D-erythritol 2,4-cyclodiphosphate synthase